LQLGTKALWQVTHIVEGAHTSMLQRSKDLPATIGWFVEFLDKKDELLLS
jgi:hypothetical protein